MSNFCWIDLPEVCRVVNGKKHSKIVIYTIVSWALALCGYELIETISIESQTCLSLILFFLSLELIVVSTAKGSIS